MPDIRFDRPLRLFSPSKVNLGLEVVHRRDDGYHEIVTVLQAVTLFDEIHLTPSNRLDFEGDPRVPAESDLALRAILLFDERVGLSLKAKVRIEKRIPLGAGLGGGSGDAGTLLAALCALSGASLETGLALAAELGSDVPFFIRGGTALASETGTTLETLPPPSRMWLVLVVPDICVPEKTASLYRSLRDDDFSDGGATRRVAAALRQGQAIDPSLLRNAFARALHQIPEVERATETMLAEGARFVLPCGAGPTLFTVYDTWQEAQELTQRLVAAGLNSIACSNASADINASRLRGRVKHAG